MNAPGQRPLRADAARNAERIMRAARAAFAELGADAALDEIARRAGVAVATLYRRFASKDELIRAVVEQRFATEIQPVIDRAMVDDDPWQGMVEALTAAVILVAEEKSTLHLAGDPSVLLADVVERYFGALAAVVRRAQDKGQVRKDLVAEDLPRLLAMLIGAVRSTEGSEEGWRRYLALLLDALRPAAANPLPPVTPLRSVESCQHGQR